jgi:hypothetical protein
MAADILRAEVVGSTIVLMGDDHGALPALDICAGLLAADLGATKYCSNVASQRRWPGEWRRIMNLLGWRYSLWRQRRRVWPLGAPFIVHEQLAQGLGQLCSARAAVAVRATLAALAATQARSPAWDILRRHAWQGTQLNVQAALLDSDGKLLIFGVRYETPEPIALHWLRQNFGLATALSTVHTHAGTATLCAALYASASKQLSTKLCNRIDTEVARLIPAP